MRNVVVMLVLVALSARACGPQDAEVRAEVERALPGCTLKAWWVGEGDGAWAETTLELRCDGRMTRCQVALESTDRGWVFSESMPIKSCRPPP